MSDSCPCYSHFLGQFIVYSFVSCSNRSKYTNIYKYPINTISKCNSYAISIIKTYFIIFYLPIRNTKYFKCLRINFNNTYILYFHTLFMLHLIRVRYTTCYTLYYQPCKMRIFFYYFYFIFF